MNTSLKISYRSNQLFKTETGRKDSQINKCKAFEGKLVIPTKDGFRVLPFEKLEVLLADGNYTSIALTSGERILISRTMKTFEGQLDNRFYRIHKSSIVNLEFLAEVNKSESCVVMESGERFEVARSKKRDFLNVLKSAVH